VKGFILFFIILFLSQFIHFMVLVCFGGYPFSGNQQQAAAHPVPRFKTHVRLCMLSALCFS